MEPEAHCRCRTKTENRRTGHENDGSNDYLQKKTFTAHDGEPRGSLETRPNQRDPGACIKASSEWQQRQPQRHQQQKGNLPNNHIHWSEQHKIQAKSQHYRNHLHATDPAGRQKQLAWPAEYDALTGGEASVRKEGEQ